jgi:hypothetical protein
VYSNEDANWEEKFWEPLDVKNQEMKLCNGSNLQKHFKPLSCTIAF